MRRLGCLAVVAVIAAIFWAAYRADENMPPEQRARINAEDAARDAARAERPHDFCAEKATDTQRDAARSMIRASGYDCSWVDSMCPFVFSEGWTVHCNAYRYQFELTNHGGRWSVDAK